MQIDLTRTTSFDCPFCFQSKLTPKRESGKVVMVHGLSPEHRTYHQHSNADDDTEIHAFAAVLVCTNPNCGMNTIVVGRLDAIPDYSGLIREYATTYTPRYFQPSVDVVPVPSCIPDAIKKALRQSFNLYFADPPAASAKLRRAVECFLDDIGIHAQGKPNFLQTRLKELKNSQPQTAALLSAVKWLGNDGSHYGADPAEQEVLDGFTVFTHALEDYYDNREVRIAGLASRISKGRPGRRRSIVRNQRGLLSRYWWRQTRLTQTQCGWPSSTGFGERRIFNAQRLTIRRFE